MSETVSAGCAADFTYDHLAPIVVVADPGPAANRALRTAEATGRRAAGPVALADAAERLALQGRSAAWWVELDASEPEPALLDRIAGGAAPAVVAAPAALLDLLFARLGTSDTTLLIDAGEAERTAALALALATAAVPERLNDIASDNSARLRQLSDEVNRIAATLARLSAEPGAAPAAMVSSRDTAAPEIAAETIAAVVRARRLRSRYFAGELFADPAWDMLLDLLQAELSHVRVPVSSLCIAAAVPATTALRWLKTMVDAGLFVRRADPHDGRRVFVELSSDASLAMRRYFAEVEGAVVV